MNAANLKKTAKSGLNWMFNTASPLFSRKSTVDAETARELLCRCSPMPEGTPFAENKCVEPECDLQIIIPAYNMEDYLAQCLDSVLSQKTKYSFRVVLIDDGSTDGTPAIADRYASDNRVTVIHQENRGFSGARNRGLETLFAKYIMFVDSDDSLCPGAVEALLDTAFSNDCDIVEGGAYYMQDGNRTVMHRYDHGKAVDDPCITLHGQPWAKVYRSALFEHIQFPEGFWYEDSILCFLVFPMAKTIYVTPEMVYCQRVNPSGITATSQGKPKSVDTYWITEAMMQAHEQAGLPVDEGYFRFLLLQIRLNQYRIRDLSVEIQESAFVLTCVLFNSTFPEVPEMPKTKNLIRALRQRDFGMYRMCCKVF